jgi:hypothetical protein
MVTLSISSIGTGSFCVRKTQWNCSPTSIRSRQKRYDRRNGRNFKAGFFEFISTC